ncbi:MAG: AI-2E family transporter [Cyanobacteria bacterium Co-bin8]|nr:AI-2E family transporter [Cyanobacteria bacterium Co-bin8]
MRLGQWVSLLALGIAIYILWQIRNVLLLLFAAAVLSTILNRVVRYLRRMHVKRGPAIAITLLLLLLALFSLFAIILPRLAGQFQLLLQVLPEVVDRLEITYNSIQARIPGNLLPNNEGIDNLIRELQTWATLAVGNLFSFVTNSVGIVLNFLLFLAAAIMLLINPIQYRRIFIMAFPAFYRPRINQILDECELSLVGWIRATFVAMIVVAAVSYLGLLILGVPLPLVNALLAGLLEFIPNIGPTLSVIPPLLLALLVDPWKAVAVVILYVLIQQFESFVLVPFVMKHEVSILPLFTLLSVVVFSVFFGFLGLFMAIPLLLVVQVWLREVLVKDVMNRWQTPSREREPIAAGVSRDL